MQKRMEDALGNLAELGRLIRDSVFDLVIAVSPENVRYTGDVFISTQVDIRDRLALIAWDGHDAPVFILCQVEEGFARQESWITDIRTYKEFVTSPIDMLAGVIEERAGRSGHIGIELDYLPASALAALQHQLARYTIWRLGNNLLPGPHAEDAAGTRTAGHCLPRH